LPECRDEAKEFFAECDDFRKKAQAGAELPEELSLNAFGELEVMHVKSVQLLSILDT
jgi:hypothetical protein